MDNLANLSLLLRHVRAYEQSREAFTECTGTRRQIITARRAMFDCAASMQPDESNHEGTKPQSRPDADCRLTEQPADGEQLPVQGNGA